MLVLTLVPLGQMLQGQVMSQAPMRFETMQSLTPRRLMFGQRAPTPALGAMMCKSP